MDGKMLSVPPECVMQANFPAPRENPRMLLIRGLISVFSSELSVSVISDKLSEFSARQLDYYEQDNKIQ